MLVFGESVNGLTQIFRAGPSVRPTEAVASGSSGWPTSVHPLLHVRAEQI